VLDDFDCTTGNGIPVVDGVVAIEIPAAVALAFGQQGVSGAGVAAAVGAAVPFAVSAIYGLMTTGSCRRARAELYARRAEAAREAKKCTTVPASPSSGGGNDAPAVAEPAPVAPPPPAPPDPPAFDTPKR
jgi:hypothetical protein